MCKKNLFAQEQRDFSCFPVPTPSLSLWASGTAQPRQILGLCLPKWGGNEAPAIRNGSREWCLELKGVEEGGAGSTWQKDRLEGQNTYLILATVLVLSIVGKPRIGL